jgi:hypothetical protein
MAAQEPMLAPAVECTAPPIAKRQASSIKTGEASTDGDDRPMRRDDSLMERFLKSLRLVLSGLHT